MTQFVLDTNFFIEAHRANYPFDVAISFWEKVKQLADEKKIISIDKVKKEIYNDKEIEKLESTEKIVKKDDVLTTWCKENLPKDFFKDTSKVIKFYSKVSNWASTRKEHYTEKAIIDFLQIDEADAWLIAYALEDIENRVIVTQEISEPNRKNAIKIPDVCVVYNIKFVNTIKMFRKLNEKF